MQQENPCSIRSRSLKPLKETEGGGVKRITKDVSYELENSTAIHILIDLNSRNSIMVLKLGKNIN